MSVTYITADLRRLVISRAAGLCEYCLLADRDTFFGCEIDHIISEKHGGATIAENLAMACMTCNQAKGSDIGSIDPDTMVYVRFFNPRIDRWTEHFQIDGDRIAGLSPTGRATAKLFDFNSHERVLERRLLREAGRYPSAQAMSVIEG